MEHIENIKKMLSDDSLKGFCITIPHKKNILPYLHASTDAVKEMQACNCVQIKNGKLFGHNTDVAGFKKSFESLLQPHHKTALILGTGGAAAAVAYVLRELGIAYQFVSRSKQAGNYTYAMLDEQIMREYTVIINASPIGTFPAIDDAPAIPYQFITERHYLYDLIYNPAKTKFLQEGEARGAAIQNGYAMLTIQAEENWRIWHS